MGSKKMDAHHCWQMILPYSKIYLGGRIWQVNHFTFSFIKVPPPSDPLSTTQSSIYHQQLNPHNWKALRCRSFALRTQSKRYRKASPWSLFCVNEKNRRLRLQAILCQYWYWIPTHKSNHEVFSRYFVCLWCAGPLKPGVEGLPWWSRGYGSAF